MSDKYISHSLSTAKERISTLQSTVEVEIKRKLVKLFKERNTTDLSLSVEINVKGNDKENIVINKMKLV